MVCGGRLSLSHPLPVIHDFIEPPASVSTAHILPELVQPGEEQVSTMRTTLAATAFFCVGAASKCDFTVNQLGLRRMAFASRTTGH